MAKIIDRRKVAMGGNDKRAVSNITGVGIHYSATPQGHTASFENHWKNTRGWITGGYHEVVLLNGDVELNYNADTISNGVYGHNSKIYNICYVGDGKPNEKQLKTLKERANYNRKRFGLSANAVKGHREFSGQSTSCPGLNMGEFRKSLTDASSSNQTATDHTKEKKSISSMADEVIAGKHGSGHANRRKSLGISDAQYQKVRAEVNKRAGSNSKPATKKSIEQMANEVLKGQHGNGHNKRRASLGISQSEYNKVKSEVNKRLMGKPSNEKSVSQMAKEVIDGKHGSGHANRRKSLGISQSQYNKVRNEVNKRASGDKATSKAKSPNINQLADKIISSSNAPTGNEARRKWLGVSKSTYDKVRAEINRRLS